jgi:outer membrane protein OmpA-like peptidoglycan-associated protein
MNEGTKLLILGHADSKGSAEFNLDLSRRRSEIIKAYLVDEFKLDAKSFSTKFFGQTWPAASNNSKVGRSQNRRVDLILE